MNNNPILQKSFDFSVHLMVYTEQLESIRKFNLANQLLRCGTSIGANVREAQNPETLKDFIHKMKVAAKEAEETTYWLELCMASNSYPDCSHLLEKVQELNRILTAIIYSSKQKLSS